MHGAPLFAKNDCVSLLAVSPLINIIRALSSGRFFWIQACTSAPFTAPGIRMSEITPAYCPFESRCNPSAPDAASTTAYPLRSSAARRNAITDGSSSISRIGCWPAALAVGRLIGPPLSPPLQRGRLLSPPESAQQTCFPRLLHCSSIESRRRAHEQSRNK